MGQTLTASNGHVDRERRSATPTSGSAATAAGANCTRRERCQVADVCARLARTSEATLRGGRDGDQLSRAQPPQPAVSRQPPSSPSAPSNCDVRQDDGRRDSDDGGRRQPQAASTATRSAATRLGDEAEYLLRPTRHERQPDLRGRDLRRLRGSPSSLLATSNQLHSPAPTRPAGMTSPSPRQSQLTAGELLDRRSSPARPATSAGYR